MYKWTTNKHLKNCKEKRESKLQTMGKTKTAKGKDQRSIQRLVEDVFNQRKNRVPCDKLYAYLSTNLSTIATSYAQSHSDGGKHFEAVLLKIARRTDANTLDHGKSMAFIASLTDVLKVYVNFMHSGKAMHRDRDNVFRLSGIVHRDVSNRITDLRNDTYPDSLKELQAWAGESLPEPFETTLKEMTVVRSKIQDLSKEWESLAGVIDRAGAAPVGTTGKK